MGITIGKYRTRGGNIATVTEHDQNETFGLAYGGYVEGVGINAWYKDGRWLEGKGDHDFDLIEHLPDEVKPKIPGKDFVERDRRIHDFGAREMPEAKHNVRQEFKLTGEDQQRRNDIALEAMKHLLLRGDVAEIEQIVDISFGIAEKMVVRGKM